jgi:hypothetical protein
VPRKADDLVALSSIVEDLIDEVRTLAVQTQKLYLEVGATRRMLLRRGTIREDTLRATVTQLDVTSAIEMSPDRPSIAGLDHVRRRLPRPRRDGH